MFKIHQIFNIKRKNLFQFVSLPRRLWFVFGNFNKIIKKLNNIFPWSISMSKSHKDPSKANILVQFPVFFIKTLIVCNKCDYNIVIKITQQHIKIISSENFFGV